MDTTQQQLERLVAKIMALPEACQEAAVAALEEVAEVPYRFSDDELGVLVPALDEARRGENLTDADTDELLNRSWR